VFPSIGKEEKRFIILFKGKIEKKDSFFLIYYLYSSCFKEKYLV